MFDDTLKNDLKFSTIIKYSKLSKYTVWLTKNAQKSFINNLKSDFE